MRRNFIIFPLFVIVASLFMSCDKVSRNGDIDGLWQLENVQGGLPDINYVGNEADDMHYWAFHLTLVQYYKPIGMSSTQRYYSHFAIARDSLYLYDFCFPSANETEEDNNVWMTEETCSEIREWGLNPIADPLNEGRVKQSLHIDHLDRNRMILSSGTTLLQFRKY